MPGEPLPTARSGLLTADHSKRGRRFVTILDEESNRVTLLEPWEHAILVLSDGTRGPSQIAELLDEGVLGEAVTLEAVHRCLRFFEHQELIDVLSPFNGEPEPVTGPRTLANLQLAYREWHKDPVKTGQILAGTHPFVQVDGITPVGLSPTVALPDDDNGGPPVAVGSTLVLGGSKSAFEAGDRPLRSVFETSGDARTEIGALDASPLAPVMQAQTPLTGPAPSEPVVDVSAPFEAARPFEAVDHLDAGAPFATLFASIRAGGSAAEAHLDQEHDVLDDDLGDVADLLAAVDSDFEELEDTSKSPSALPSAGRAIGGEAWVPPAQHEAPTPSTSSMLDADHGSTQEVVARPLTAGVADDTQRFDLPTEGGFAASHPFEIDSRGPTASKVADHQSQAVFTQVCSLGAQARRIGQPDIFQQGLEGLTEGDLELLLEHCLALLERMPRSTRLRTFCEVVREVLETGVATGPQARFMLEHFTRAVDNATKVDVCACCLSTLEQEEDVCMACGFGPSVSGIAYSAG